MSRATTEVREGGLKAAIARYQNQPTPPLIIVESQDAAPALIEQFDRLAQVCDAGAKVVVIGAHNDIALYRELMRRGVSRISGAAAAAAAADRRDHHPLRRPGRRRSSAGRSRSSAPAAASAPRRVAHNLAYLLSETMRTNTVHRRSRPAVRHRRPRFQPGPPAGRRRRAQPARPARPGAARPDDGPLRRAPQPVRRAGDAGCGLRHRAGGLRGGHQQDPRDGALCGARPAAPLVAAGCAARCSAPTTW